MIVLNTNHGAITLELDFDKAPLSAANFLDYAKSDDTLQPDVGH